MEINPRMNCTENKNFKAWIDNDIFYIIYYCEVLSLNVIKDALKVRLELSKGASFPMLSDIRGIKNIEQEARKFIALQENNRLLRAGALLVNNQFHKVVGNLFLLTNKLPVPSKLFIDETAALEWLNQHKATV